MADLTAKLSVNLLGNYTDPLDLVTARDILDKIYELSLADGTGTDKGDKQWHDQRTVAASTNDDIELDAVVDAFGDALAVAKVKMLFIKNNSTTQTLTVGAAATNPWQGPFGATNDTIAVPPSGCLVLFNGAGWTVTSGSADQLRIANGAGSAAVYDIVLWGASA